jgi:hypothetical protein
MGSYPAFAEGRYRTELVLRGRSPERLERVAEELRAKLAVQGLI